MAFAETAFQGSVFKIGSPLTAVEGVISCPPMPQKKNVIDTTAINVLAETSISDPLVLHEAFDITLNYDKDNTQHMALLTAFKNGTSVAGQLLMSDTETFTGDFLVMAWTPAGDRGTPARRIVNLKPTGTITIA